jgi:TetR/AcrR family transcriptional regulator, ethionamide resistance regulator
VSQATETRPDPRARRQSVRASLRRALLELVEETPFKEISVADIAAAAGLKRSAFYFYFSDKRELLVAATTEAAEELYREADRWWHGEGRSEERLKSALRGMADLYERNASLLRVATEVSTYDGEVRVFWRAVVERFIVATEDHLRDEQRAGRVPRALEARPTAESLVWMAERCCYVYLASGERTAAELVEALSATWAAALYPDSLLHRDGRAPRRHGDRDARGASGKARTRAPRR